MLLFHQFKKNIFKERERDTYSLAGEKSVHLFALGRFKPGG